MRLISSGRGGGLVIPDVCIYCILWFIEEYRALPMPLMFVSRVCRWQGMLLVQFNFFVSLMYEGKLLPYGRSYWSTNWDIILVVLSQLDTFVDVQRLTKMHSLLQGLPAERGRERRDSKHFAQEIYKQHLI